MSVSKAVSDKLMVSRAVEHAIGVRGKEVAGELESILFPDGAPETLTTAGFIEALAGTLARVGGELEAADLAHADELADDGQYREQRDEARSALQELLQRARSMLDGSHGSSAVARVGLTSALPKNNQPLIAHARHVAAQLTPAKLGEPVDDLAPVNLDALQKQVGQAAQALEDSLSHVERERREAQQTLTKRDDASEVWSRTYLGVANGFMALAILAGFDEVAERVKPTARRRAGRPEPADEEVAAASEGESEGEGEGEGEGGSGDEAAEAAEAADAE